MKKILFAIIPLLTIGFFINYANAIENPFDLSMQTSEKEIISDASSMTPREQMLTGLTANQVMCKDGLNLVIKVDGTPACVKASTIFKLIERSWISMDSAFAEEHEPDKEQVMIEQKTTTHLDFLPDDNDRAMYFVARFSEGLIPYTEVIKSNFIKFIPFEDYTFQINPENPLPKKPPFKFLLETLPNKDNIGYYRAIDDYFQIDSKLFKDFDANIDVVSGDGTVLQTWEYLNCDLEDFSVYLQDNVLFDRFSGSAGPEIRERSIFECGGFSLVAPEN